MAWRRLCMTLDIEGGLRLSDRELGGWLIADDGHRMTGKEARRALLRLKAQGFEVVPTCDNVDARGRCRGHNEKDEVMCG